ncbi:MAG: adenylosuccinate lyase [Candidatus Microgenomates bacterium]
MYTKTVKKSTTSLNFFDSISPLDGRYFLKLHFLKDYFSEFSLVKYRVLIEVKYLFLLSKQKIIRDFKKEEVDFLNRLLINFNKKEFLKIKNIEEKINHDVKAVEYYLQGKLTTTTLKDIVTFIHFGLTSEDINNLSYSLILEKFKKEVLETKLKQLIVLIFKHSKEWKDKVMLARTHGQLAVPTTIGKELINYGFRLKKQYEKLKKHKFEGKITGAVGNLNALKFVLPEKNWLKITENFIKSFSLQPNLYTTQILFYDNYLEFFQIIKLINFILIDFSVNIWLLIMLDVFKQQKKENEVGSSTMPQKVNPIDFEQAEGSLGVANSMFNFFEQKLSHSRLQRDLSDSIIRRIFGESLGFTILGWKNIENGLEKIYPNEKTIKQELENNYQVLTEAIQTVLRLKNQKNAYDKVKHLTRGKKMSRSDYFKLLEDLGLNKDKKLNELTTKNYIGYAKKLIKKII